MFEHLGPTPEVNIKPRGTNYKMYLSALFLSVFVFMLAFSTSQGPSSQATGAKHLSAQVFVDASDKQIVSSARNFSLFDFVVNVDQADTSLYKLNILAEGVYTLDFISDLKLFHEGVQLGEVAKLDNNGKIYFDLSQYKLPLGQNTFSLFVNKNDNLKDSPALSFSIGKDDIFLISQGEVFKPQAQFPLTGGLISIVDKGQVVAFNNYQADDFLIRSNVPQRIASFNLSVAAEQADLSQIILSYEGSNQEETSDEVLDFVLEYDNQIISQASGEDGQVIFDLNKKIVLKDRDRKTFYLHTLAMPEGLYKFSVQAIKANGFLSGLDLSLKNSVSLSQFEAKPYFIEMQNGDLDTKLSEGWNKIYSLKIRTQGIAEAQINKLTWKLDAQNLAIDGIEILRNGQVYIADAVLRDDKLIIKSDASNPLLISREPIEILVLADISQVSDKAKLEMAILTDDSFDSEDSLTGNIIWSDGDNFYNGYKMPHLPLSPSILSN